MANPRTLITGAAGFTGRYLTDLLVNRGHEVFGLGHSSAEEPAGGVARMSVADLADSARLDSIIREVRPTYVVHLAAIAFVAHGDVGEMYRTNIVGTRNLLQSVAESGALPDQVLVASSANIYGNSDAGTLDEDVPANPANDYGVSKLATESVARLYANRLPITIVRPFNYTGVGQSPNFLIPKIVDHVRRRAEVIELGNLDVARDFSDVRGVVDAYARLLEELGTSGATYNVCSGEAVSLRQLIDMVQDVSGHRFEVRVNPAFVRADEVKYLRGSAERLEARIGPLAMPPLQDTLRWMIEA